MPNRILTALVLLSCADVTATVQEKERAWALKFDDYAVTEVFHGRPARPFLSTRAQRRFRNVVRKSAAQGPNFAGHFTIAAWGCGSGCVSAAVIDAITGGVYNMPFKTLSLPVPADGKDRDYRGPVYQFNSRLFIADGCPEEKNCATYYYEWQDHRFKLLRVDRLSPSTMTGNHGRSFSVIPSGARDPYDYDRVMVHRDIMDPSLRFGISEKS